MDFNNFLEDNKEIIKEKWYSIISKTYKDTTGKFFLHNRDKQFSNPVAWTFSKEIPIILDEIIKGKNSEELQLALENIIRIRAVQEFSPSESLFFILNLKSLIKEMLGNSIEDKSTKSAFEEFENKIDALLLVAFDIYISMREKLMDMKINEVKRKYDSFLKRFEKKYGETNDLL